MVIIEVLVGVLIFALAVVATAGLYIGLLGIAGAVRFVRCDRCGHLGMTSASDPLRSCTYCRHGRLFHPLYAMHHTHDEKSPDKQKVGVSR